MLPPVGVWSRTRLATDPGTERRLVAVRVVLLPGAVMPAALAYEALIALHADVAFRTAFLISRNEADAADAVNEAFYRAFTALRRFRSGHPFRPWILRIVSNAAKDRRASASRGARLAVRLSEHAFAEPASSAEAVVTALESRDEVVAAVGRLCERDRLVIAYRYFLCFCSNKAKNQNST